MSPFPSAQKGKMTSVFSSALSRGKAFLTPSHSSTSLSQTGFSKAPEGTLFPQVDPAIDGEDCDHDCSSCTIKYPAKFKIDEHDKLYGHVKGWSTHLLVATGKTDWVRDVSDEKGSVMEAVKDCGIDPSNGKLMLSASNIPLPSIHHTSSDPTSVLLLPAFTIIEKVTPATVPTLISQHINNAPTNTTPFPPPTSNAFIPDLAKLSVQDQPTSPSPFTTRPCPHKYLILLCSQRTRDARCGQSAPLLRRELERHLRPLGLYRDLHDERPGGVGIYFISHVGGHKYSANMMVYRRGTVFGGNRPADGEKSNGKRGDEVCAEASQCIWLARVRPEDCEGIVKFTILQGKVVKPARQLRGGFDREKGLVSW